MDKLLDLLSFEGRANRAWYFWHIVLDDLVILTAMIVGVLLGVATHPVLAIPFAGVVLGAIWGGVAITVKRLHDLGRPGWQVLLLALPVIQIYFGFITLFKQGTIGPNQYGPDPLEAAGQRDSLYP